MADDDKELSLHDQVAAAFDGVDVEEKAPVEREEVGEETATEKADRARDEAGRFAKAEERKTLSLKEKPSEPAAEPKAPTNAKLLAEQPPLEAGKERIAAPTSWLGAAKTKWDRLPREVQQEIATREAERETAAGEVAPMKELFDANRQWVVNAAGSMQAGLTELMQFGRIATQGSVDEVYQLLNTIAARRGIDLRALAGGQQAQPAPGQQQPNNIEAVIEQRVKQALQPYTAQFEAHQQQQTQATVAQVQAFMADPAHPYFNDVSRTIERLLGSGEIPPGDPMTRLKEAYDRATWSNPAIRSQLMAATTEEADRRKAADAEKARLASRTSLKGSPLPNGHAAVGGKGQSVRDAVAAAWDDASGA